MNLRPIPQLDARNPLVLPLDQRAAIFGRTGTGKTTLARSLLQPRASILILDPKADWRAPTWGDWKAYSDPRKVIQRLGQHVIYRPKPEAIDDLDAYDKILRAAFKRGNLTIDIDELALVAPAPTRYPPMLKACYQQGRGRRICIIGLSQRPVGTPGFTRSECEKYYCFALHSPADIKTAREVIGEDYALRRPRGHEFYYRSVEEDDPRYMLLEV